MKYCVSPFEEFSDLAKSVCLFVFFNGINSLAHDLRNSYSGKPNNKRTFHRLPLVSGHPWIVDDKIAPDRPLDSAVLSRLKQFSAMNKLKKMALRVRFSCNYAHVSFHSAFVFSTIIVKVSYKSERQREKNRA